MSKELDKRLEKNRYRFSEKYNFQSLKTEELKNLRSACDSEIKRRQNG